jgi:hypothetical protein
MGAKTGGASAVVDILPIFLLGPEYVDVHILNIIDLNRVFGAHVRRIPRDDPETSRHATKRRMNGCESDISGSHAFSLARRIQ